MDIKQWLQKTSLKLKETFHLKPSMNVSIDQIKQWASQSVDKLKFPRINKEDLSGITSILKGQTLFAGLDDDQYHTLGKHVKIVALNPTEKLKEHPEITGKDLYILLSGNLLVTKLSQPGMPAGNPTEYGAGEVLNVLRLTNADNAIEICSVIRPVTCLVVDMEGLSKDSQYKNIRPKLLGNMANQFSERLQHTEQVLVKTNMIAMQSISKQLEEAKVRVLFGAFIMRMIIVLCVYTLGLRSFEILQTSTFIDPELSTYSFLLIVGIIIFLNMIKSDFPISEFGLTTANWRISIVEGIIAWIFLFGCIILLKLYLITYIPEFHHVPLFEVTTGFDRSFHLVDWKVPFHMFIYLVFVVVQEFLVRGALQGPLYSFVTGSNRHRHIVSILISNLIFITFHSHISFSFGAVTFFPGLVWGYIYSRHKTLIGVSISHALVGISIIFILGANSIVGGGT